MSIEMVVDVIVGAVVWQALQECLGLGFGGVHRIYSCELRPA